MWLLGWDGISMLEGEKVSFDAYLGFTVSWVCLKVNFCMFWGGDANYGYVCKMWQIIGYVDMMSFVAIYEFYVKYHVMLRNDVMIWLKYVRSVMVKWISFGLACNYMTLHDDSPMIWFRLEML